MNGVSMMTDLQFNLCQKITHLPLDEMTAISQTTHSNAFSSMKTSVF